MRQNQEHVDHCSPLLDIVLNTTCSERKWQTDVFFVPPLDLNNIFQKDLLCFHSQKNAGLISGPASVTFSLCSLQKK